MRKVSHAELSTLIMFTGPKHMKEEVDECLDGFECTQLAVDQDDNLVSFSPRASFMVGVMTGFMIHKLAMEDE